MPDEAKWALERFDDCLDRWIDTEEPDVDLRLTVTAWVLSRFDDPFVGARRDDGFTDMWEVTVPESRRGGEAVLCSFRVLPAERLVICDSIATLGLPH